jgi:hypothetical protein
MMEIPKVVAPDHGFQIAILEANAFNLFLAEMAGAPPNRETPFRRSVDKVRSRAQIAREIRIGTYRFKRRRSSTIAVLPDQSVDSFVFAKLLYARRKDDQLRTAGQCHGCTVDSLVAQPCAVKLKRIEINHGLPDGHIQRFEVHS